MRKIIGVIPARGGSQRFPNKNIANLNGKPLIVWTIEAALASDLLDKVIVSTDHIKIAKISKKVGAEVIKRPKKYATAEAPIEWALQHTVRTLEAAGTKIDVLVWLSPCNPIRRLGAIDSCIEKLLTGYSGVVTVVETRDQPEWLMLKTDNGYLVPATAATTYRHQELPKYYKVDGSVLAMTRDILMAVTEPGVHRYLGHEIGYVLQDWCYGWDVDELSDLKIAEALINHARTTI